jgi:hypothetical protein
MIVSMSPASSAMLAAAHVNPKQGQKLGLGSRRSTTATVPTDASAMHRPVAREIMTVPAWVHCSAETIELLRKTRKQT